MKAYLAHRPYYFSLLIVVLMALWIASGQFVRADGTDDVAVGQDETVLPKVRVRAMQSQPVDRSITLFARTEPDRLVVIKTETIGKVSGLTAKHGDRVKVGDEILRIDMKDRQQQLKSGKLLLKQRQLEYEGAKSLISKGFQNQVQLAQATALLQDARATVAQLQLDINNTKIVAPFAGIVSEKYVDVGEYLSPGDPVVKIVDLDPLIIRADITQGDIGSLRHGQTAEVVFPDGKVSEGEIRYLSSVADAETNTFRMEVEIANPDYHLLAGMSAEINISLENANAIFISPSLLSLNDKGEIGLKSVADGKVIFSRIAIVRTESDGIWVSGINNPSQVIIVGQGFVRAGDEVEAIAEQS